MSTTNRKPTVSFETKVCGRCGGTGRHSYNTMDGDRCYGCHGGSRIATKRGEAARAAFAAKRLELCGVEVAALQPGQKFLSTEGKWATVVSVTREHDGSRWLDKTTGEWVPYTTVTTQHSSRSYCLGTERVIVSFPELWPALVAYAQTLPGVTITNPVLEVA